MTGIPFYNVIILPDVTYYLQKDFYGRQADGTPEEGEQVLFFVTKRETDDDLKPDDILPIGVVGRIAGVAEDGTVAVLTEERVRYSDVRVEEGSVTASWEPCPWVRDLTDEEIDRRFQDIKRAMIQSTARLRMGNWVRSYIANWKSLEEAVVYTSYMLGITSDEKYAMLAADTYSECFALMETAINQYLQMFLVSQEASEEQQENSERLYREQAIRRQLEILQQKLDDMNPDDVSDIKKFEEKIENSGMNETAMAEAKKILGRMKQEGQNGHEYGMLYDYLDFVTGLSWKKEPFEPHTLKEAEEILDRDHFGMKKVKRRILQQLAVMTLNKKQAGSILLFVGAPGTGKTSIGQSIADALNRKYVRISLGGVRDEADIRGHRRTYIGAMPGRIMDGIRRSGVSNPVVVLDEVDKLARDYAGDPASALLEVLDPEQNFSFTDHYMNVPYDLSDVLFICTANRTDTIPEPLLNRMETIEFQGYTETDKIQIGRRHLLPKAMEQAGIPADMLKISPRAWHTIISDYTMEAGVRGLRRQLDTLCRTAAVRLADGEMKAISVTERNLRSYLDQKPIRHEGIQEKKNPGIVTGLAWTQAGGDVLFVETMFSRGKGKQIITGQLGDVMKESAKLAVTLVKNRFPEHAERFTKEDLHIHVPAGAVPKDGPSAGITLTTALASLVTERAVDPTLAMTGEVSLRGQVLPIGGLPEKLLAAVRAGVKTVCIPADNEQDLEDVAGEVKSRLNIILVHTVDEVLKQAGILD